MMRVRSIRARLLWRLVPIVVACCFLASGFVYFGTRAELNDALDAQSDILALTIAGLEGDTIPLESFGAALERYAEDYLIRVWDADGAVLVDSSAALASLPLDGFAQTAPAALGPAWDVREYLLGSGEKILIARLKQESDQLVLQVALTSLVPLALALLGAILTAAYLVRQGLVPLTSLSQELTRRSASDLHALPTRAVADELQPIVDELNGLFARIETSLARERRFVDDAAHELRTPLSVIKAQCQAIDPASLTTDAQARLAHIVEGVDRMTALSRQLLDQARAEQTAPVGMSVNVAKVLRGVIADLTPDAERQGVEIQIIGNGDPVLQGSPQDLQMILTNLLENAVKFCGTPGHVLVTLSAHELTIEDDGLGIPEQDRDAVFERFFQSEKTAGLVAGAGAGLGLSIVRSLAQRNDLRVTAEAGATLPGACFRLRWTDGGTQAKNRQT